MDSGFRRNDGGGQFRLRKEEFFRPRGGFSTTPLRLSLTRDDTPPSSRVGALARRIEGAPGRIGSASKGSAPFDTPPSAATQGDVDTVAMKDEGNTLESRNQDFFNSPHRGGVSKKLRFLCRMDRNRSLRRRVTASRRNRRISRSAREHLPSPRALGPKKAPVTYPGIPASLEEGVAAHLDRVAEVAIPPPTAAIELHAGEVELSAQVRQIDVEAGIADHHLS